MKNPENISKIPTIETNVGANKENVEETLNINKNEASVPLGKQIENNEEKAIINKEKISESIKSAENTKKQLDEARNALGLPPTKEIPPSQSFEEDKLNKLKSDQEKLEKQKEELITQKEKEELIKKEKEKLLQEKLEALFKEFETLKKNGEFVGVLNGQKGFESKSAGSISPETVKSLAELFEKGIKMLPEILKNLPEIQKQFDEQLTKEATERVDKLIAEGKRNVEEQKAEKMMDQGQLNSSREREAESMMDDNLKKMSNERSQTLSQKDLEKAA